MLVPVIAYQECVGCGACVEVCPDVFEMRDDRAWVKNYEDIFFEECKALLELCPTKAITFEKA